MAPVYGWLSAVVVVVVVVIVVVVRRLFSLLLNLLRYICRVEVAWQNVDRVIE